MTSRNPEAWDVTWLEAVVNGDTLHSFGLHLIGTPDTAQVVEKVREKIQALLDLEFENNRTISRREIVTTQIIPFYHKFQSWEIVLDLKETVRNKHVYFFGDPNGAAEKIEEFLTGSEIKQAASQEKPNYSDKMLHSLFALGCIAENGARTTNAVFASMPYSRQDQPTQKRRQPSSFKMVADWIQKITTRDGYVICLDLHNPSSKSFFSETNFLNLHVGWFIEEVRRKMKKKDMRLLPTDQGWDKKMSAIAEEQRLPYDPVLKRRSYSQSGVVDETLIYSEIEGQNILIHDDMLDGGGTLISLLEKILAKKPKSINVAITHWMFNGAAKERLWELIKKSKWVIEKIYVTNSIYRDWLPDFVEQIDDSQIIANTITSIYKGTGVDRNDAKDYTLKVRKKKGQKSK